MCLIALLNNITFSLIYYITTVKLVKLIKTIKIPIILFKIVIIFVNGKY